MKLFVLLTATLLASANARSLRLPEARFASLEGFAEDMYDAGAEAVRAPRHLTDFAEFDRPLSSDAVDLNPHHRFARGAAEPCDCADNPDLVGEIVETAPVEEGPFCTEFVVPPQSEQPVLYELVEAPEERAGVQLTADDAQLEDDQEATLCDVGLHPEDEADVEPCAGRPARQLEVGSIQDEDSEEAKQTEVLEGKSAVAEEVDAEASAQEEIGVSKEVKSEATKGVKAEISEGVKAEDSEGVKSEAIEGVKVEASESVKEKASEGLKVEASEGVEDKVSEGVKAGASEDVKDTVSEDVDVKASGGEKVEANDGAAAVLGAPASESVK